MKEIFLEYAKTGAMTKEQLANVLKVKVSWIGNKVREGIIPIIPGIRVHRFDPMRMIEVFCGDSKQVRSLTTERRESGGNPKSGGFQKCL